MRTLVADYVHEKYDRGPFKLVCDDLGLANLIVKNDNDLTVVGVIDLEWSYIGSAQLFASAPWWLLQDRPINPEWDHDSDQAPAIAARYFRYLDIYKRVLQEEEAKRPGHESKEVSKLVKWSEDSGAMWFHMLLSCGFNDANSFPFTKLKEHVGTDKWKELESALDPNEIAVFVERKTLQLEQYDAELAKTNSRIACVDRGEMTREELIAKHYHP